MRDVPRWLARIWFTSGAVGLVTALLGAALGIGFVRSSTSTALDGLSVTDRSLGTFVDTAHVLRSTLADVSDALRGVQQTMADSSVTMTQLAKLTGDVGDVVSVDVPDSLDAVREAMPPLIATAGVIDTTMRALRFVGVDYDPDQPLDEALVAIDQQLGEIPATLQAQRGLFDGVADGLAEFGRDSLGVAADLAAIRSSLGGSRQLLDEYVDVAGRASELVTELAERLASQARLAQVLIAIFGVALGGAMTLPLAAGWVATGRDLPGAGRRGAT